MNFPRGRESTGKFHLASPFTSHGLELVTWPHPTTKGLGNAIPPHVWKNSGRVSGMRKMGWLGEWKEDQN